MDEDVVSFHTQFWRIGQRQPRRPVRRFERRELVPGAMINGRGRRHGQRENERERQQIAPAHFPAGQDVLVIPVGQRQQRQHQRRQDDEIRQRPVPEIVNVQLPRYGGDQNQEQGRHDARQRRRERLQRVARKRGGVKGSAADEQRPAPPPLTAD